MPELPATIVLLSLSCALPLASCVPPAASNGADASVDDVDTDPVQVQTGEAEEPLSREYCEAQRDAILVICSSPATPSHLRAACVAAAWIGFVGCLRLPGDA